MFFKFIYILIIVLLLAGAANSFAQNSVKLSGQQAPPAPEWAKAQGGFMTILQWLFPFMIAAAVIIATLSIIYAGFEWMAGAISPPQIESAKNRIYAAVLGLAVALGSWLILNTISPTFTNPKAPVGFTLKCDGPCPTWNEVLFGASTAPNTEPKPVGDFGGLGVDTRGLNSEQMLEAQRKLEQKCAPGKQAEYVGGAIICTEQVSLTSSQEQKDQRRLEQRCLNYKKQAAVNPSRAPTIPPWCSNILSK